MGLALVYALAILFVPWDNISRGGFSDFETYVETFEYYGATNQSKRETEQITSVRQYVLSEILWHEFMVTLTRATGDAPLALRIVSFFILFVWGSFLFKRLNPGTALLFLINPMSIDVAMSGIRNGFAWALVMLGLSSKSKLLRAVIFVTATMIHSSSVVLLVLYYGVGTAARIFKGKSLLVVGLGSGAVVGLALTIGSTLILGALGDRRTGDEYVVGGGSNLQASVWGALLILQCLSGTAYIRRNMFIIAVLAWYLTMNPFIPWSYRIWGAFLPVIAVSALELPIQKRQIFMSLYIAYLVIQFFYWTKIFEHWHPA